MRGAEEEGRRGKKKARGGENLTGGQLSGLFLEGCCFSVLQRGGRRERGGGGPVGQLASVVVVVGGGRGEERGASERVQPT